MSKSWNRRALVALAAQCLLLGAASEIGRAHV